MCDPNCTLPNAILTRATKIHLLVAGQIILYGYHYAQATQHLLPIDMINLPRRPVYTKNQTESWLAHGLIVLIVWISLGMPDSTISED